jgi:hypothetical protein
MRLAVAARDGVPLRALPTEFSQMSVRLEGPGDPAIAQEMDAAVKGKDGRHLRHRGGAGSGSGWARLSGGDEGPA